ncbi:MAG: hypothetical protein GXO31_07095 [Epsilonproteobacteria bacterium]|nr:hypothetical protein [Campylobacterota bacterium]
MRVTNLLTYNQFLDNYRRSNFEMNKITTQLSSGKKISDSYEDSLVYSDSMRLTFEHTSLQQIQQVSSQAQAFADNSDQILNQFTESLEQFKTKLLQANNASQDKTSISAIANDLKRIKEHLVTLANTSINGQYLFSGTAMKNEPIDLQGNYHGNDKNLIAVVSPGIQEAYNITGEELFLGRDNDFNKKITTNVTLYNQSELHPNIMKEGESIQSKEVFLQPSDTIRDMVGDTDSDQTNDSNAYFYVYGKKPNGESFKSKIELSTDKSVQDLLDKIGALYGNTENTKVVDVSLTKRGHIEIKDLKEGNEKMDFFMVGAIDRSGGNGANVNDIDDLTTNPDVDIIEFIKSDFTPSPGIDQRVAYDRENFTKLQDTLTSNVSQIDKDGNFAKLDTKLVDTSGVDSLDGVTFNISLKDVNSASHTVTIDLSSNSTFTVDGNTYTIYNSDGTQTQADQFTYRQLTDIISMITSNTLPASDTKQNYDNAIIEARKSVESGVDYRGRLYIKDKTTQNSNLEFSIYDKDSDDFTKPNSPVLTFQANDALVIDKPSIDLFKDLDEIIKSVEEVRFNPDGNKEVNPRLPGIDAAIERLDHISTHVIRKHTKIGSISNFFQKTEDRSMFLDLNVKKLKSEVEDIDIAEALVKFNQININFQAMLSSISKINSLSMVNYI